ncbi:MAG: M28 family peptidase [Acidobacteria bacterium]|nr:M28 family peptidase [Acidobacteriota bacterium]
MRPRFAFVSLFVFTLAGLALLAQAPPDRCLVPPAIRDPILGEVSGERAHLHVQMLAANRDRQASEYTDLFFETTYIRDRAAEAGLSDVQVDLFPGRDTWDAEEGDLWMVQPERKKIASITTVPASLAIGSRTSDVEAELVYVGAGRQADYEGKDVAGKIVLGAGPVGGVFGAAVNQRGAAGALGTATTALEGEPASYSLDQVGWSSVYAATDRAGFGFQLSLRQFLELRNLVERGQKVVLRAHVRSRTYPGRQNVVSAAIPGSDPAAGELILVAHAFETIATPGANDNCTGVGTTLEVGRTLARLIRDGVLPRPRRTIRFLWAPEISGTTQYMFKHPELQERLHAALNFDMTGANPKTTDAYLRVKLTPDSRPSYLNDLIASLLRYVDQTNIRSPQGANATFNYRLTPVAAITSGSDHSVFNNGGIPAMQFNYWNDSFYHSSGDRAEHADPTEMKRVAFMAAAAMYYLSTAGPAEARDLAWEAAANGQAWIAEVARQAAGLMAGDGEKLARQHEAAQLKVAGAFQRAQGGVESVLALARDAEVGGAVRRLVGSLQAARDLNARLLEGKYRERAAARGIAAVPQAAPGARERECDLLVPRRLFPVYSSEAQRRAPSPGTGQRGAGRPAAAPMGRMPGIARSEVANFIDGKRSILEIYRAVRAECGNLVVGSDDQKFAYVLSPDAPDVDLEQVVAAIEALENNGTVEILKREQPRGKRRPGSSAPSP